jgi:hypothetical protein
MATVTKLKRRERNYIGKVEANLRQIYRQAKSMADADADITPTDMRLIMIDAQRALEALGWEVR